MDKDEQSFNSVEELLLTGQIFGRIVQCRERGFKNLENQPDYLNRGVIQGSFYEKWSLRKVLRRFIWHDRIHEKAMRRMALKTFGKDVIF